MSARGGGCTRRLAVALLAATLVAAGCVACSSGSDDDEASPEPTPWQRELADLEPDGSRSLDSALTLFAMAIGPIPGVPEQTRPKTLVDATPAIATLLAYEDQPTPEQRAAVDAALQPEADAITFEVPPVGDVPPLAETGGGGRRRPVAVPQQQPPTPRVVRAIQNTLETARRQIASRIGYDFTGVMIVAFGDAGAGNYAVTTGRWGPTGQDGCQIIVNLGAAGPSILAHVLFHETFHCFQNAAQPTPTAANGAYRNNAWAWEGGAVWAINDLLGPDVNTPYSWATWLETPKQPLFAKAYEAIGFFAHLDETGTNPWSTFRGVYATASADAAFAAAGGTKDAFLDSWASGYLRDRRLGKAWDFTGKSITGNRVNPTSVSIGKNESRSFSVDPYTNDQLRLVVAADVLEVAVRGHGRLADGRHDYVLKGGREFCTNGVCKCPDQKQGPEKLANESSFALTGGVFGTKVTVTGRDFDERACKKKQRTPRGRNVGILVTRPAASTASATIDELDVFDLAACNGIYGRWSGVVRTGGFRIGAIVSPVVEVPVEFTVDRSGHGAFSAHLPGMAIGPIGQADVPVDAAFTVTVHDRQMDITGNFGLDVNTLNIPIRRTAKGNC
jgi:hypothetical protein